MVYVTLNLHAFLLACARDPQMLAELEKQAAAERSGEAPGLTVMADAEALVEMQVCMAAPYVRIHPSVLATEPATPTGFEEPEPDPALDSMEV